jgi:hypothetical protein
MADALISPQSAEVDKRATTPPRQWQRLRFVPLAIGALAMALGFWTGLQRLGLPLPGAMDLGTFHGALMIAGFLGTVIGLERAVAVGRWWAYAAPVASAIGALALIAGAPLLAALAFLTASGVLLAASIDIALRQLALFTIVLATAAACWAAGTFSWLIGSPMPAVVGWWLDFLILTIAAERLELGRLVRLSSASQTVFAVLMLLLVGGAARGELAGEWAPVTSAGLIGLAAWLLRNDLARRTIRQAGLPRFSAVAILAGHGWLGVAGVVLAMAPLGAAAFSYDAAVHAITIGFVLSMVFGHAPIILPAVTGLRIHYSALAYAPLALLHASVALRVGSDVFAWIDLRIVSGIATVLALLGYAATLAAKSWRRPI